MTNQRYWRCWAQRGARVGSAPESEEGRIQGEEGHQEEVCLTTTPGKCFREERGSKGYASHADVRLSNMRTGITAGCGNRRPRVLDQSCATGTVDRLGQIQERMEGSRWAQGLQTGGLRVLLPWETMAMGPLPGPGYVRTSRGACTIVSTGTQLVSTWASFFHLCLGCQLYMGLLMASLAPSLFFYHRCFL